MITENLSTLKIHKLSQAQYDRAVENGAIDENALYLTPDEEITPIENGGTGAYNAADARLNLGAAPDGYGLGGNAILKDWATVDALIQNGWYRFHLENGIDVGARKFNYAWMRVDAYSNAHAIQTLYPVCDNKGYVLTRSKSNSGWTEWAWENPPMVLGIEYKTTELWKNKHVYTLMVEFSDKTDGSGSLNSIPTNAQVIRKHAFNNSGDLPQFDSTGILLADIQINPTTHTVYYRDARTTKSGNVNVQVWYTKD